MNEPILQVGEQAIYADEIPALLSRYQMMSQVWRGIITDKAIADIPYVDSERAIAIKEFEKYYQITSNEAKQVWLRNHGMTLQGMEELAVRNLKIYKFKKANFSNKINSYFLKRKVSYDQVIYSLIRVKDKGLASEIYFRIQAGEQSFAELAREYSQGIESHTGGVLGPTYFTQMHPNLAKVLAVSKPGQLWAPNYIEGYFIIIRLDKLLPARLDDVMRRKLLDELFEHWLDEQVKLVCDRNYNLVQAAA
ncbi:MAG: peptidylprolyl isomerase [Methylacidiphilales bacterium]|nr:peptidylprolyl isomerase [Candidatus Methylacidiphilales bacterium]NJR16923.1 peptidylprolyl isomerase [Calothrix sp. CSU_2_0]